MDMSMNDAKDVKECGAFTLRNAASRRFETPPKTPIIKSSESFGTKCTLRGSVNSSKHEHLCRPYTRQAIRAIKKNERYTRKHTNCAIFTHNLPMYPSLICASSNAASSKS